MDSLTAAGQLAFARARANWRLLAPIVLGVLVAVTLLASAPLYAGVLNDLGLRYTLRREPPSRADILIQSTNRQTKADEYAATSRAVGSRISGALGTFVGTPVRYGRAASQFVYRPGEPIAQPGQTQNNQPRGYLQFADRIDQNLTIVSGNWPADGAIAGREATTELGLKVGDRVLLAPVTGGPSVEVPIVAIADIPNADDPYWTVGAVRLTDRARDWVILPLIVSEDRFFASGATTSDFTTRYPIDLQKVTTANAPAARDATVALRATLPGSVPGTTIVTALDTILSDYLSKLATTEIPLYLLILQIVGLVLFYLVLVSGVLVDRQSGEIALLKSRGASSGQILLLFVVEGLLICLLAVIIGPPLAALLTVGLVNLPGSPLAGAPGVRLSAEVWVLAAAAAMLALMALLVPAWGAARSSIVLYRRDRARSAGRPFWQRTYLDVILLAVAAAGYWAIQRQAGLSGANGIDPLLLLSPAILALAVSFALLRLFPMVLRLVLRLGAGAASAPVLLGLWQMSRRPAPYTRLVLLLTLTTSLGLFAATFSGTIDRSYQDRTAYRVGSDVRIEGIAGGTGRPKAQIGGTLAGTEGVREVAAALRESGQVGPQNANRRYRFLAIDANAPDVVWFRSDFAGGRTAADILRPLDDNAAVAEGILVPEGGEAIGLAVRPSAPQPYLALTIRLKDADNALIDVELGRLGFSDWRTLDGPLPANARGPLRVSSVYLTQQGGLGDINAGSILVDDLTVREASGIRRVVEPFDAIGPWDVLRDGIGDARDDVERVTTGTRSGTPALRFAWSPRRTFGTRGLRLREEETPLPVVVSPSFLAASSRSVGETLPLAIGDRTIQATIRGTIDSFPTLDPVDNGFVLAALDPTIGRLNAVPGRPIYPNEAWARIDPAANVETIRAAGIEQLGARTVLARRSLLGEASSDPLVAAGFSGILALAFLAALGLSLVGFLAQSYLALQRRLVELAILRTMGLSLAQLVGLLAFEQIAMTIAGIAAGTVLGLQIGSLMLPLLELTERGGRVLPTFVITTQWQYVLPAYLLILLFFGGIIAAMGLLLARLPIGRTLRIGES